MKNSPLPPDDLPPSQTGHSDGILRRQLEDALSKYFYESCDGVTQALLTNCEWYFNTIAVAPTLVINCPDAATNWRVLNNVVAIATALSRFSSSAKIRVCPPVEAGTPFEIRVDEISVYRDPL
jgi:hypothetical protein